MFKFLYFIFLISIIFGSSVYLGIGTPRQYMTIIMFLYCFVHFKKMFKYWNRLLTFYVLFIFCYCIGSFMEGSGNIFIRQFIAFYFVGILAYFTTRYFVQTRGNYSSIINVVLISGIVNSIITILQYFGSSVGIALGSIFVDFNNELRYYQFIHMVNGDAGCTYFGLLGDGVSNSFFTMMLPIFSLYYIFEKKSSVLMKYVWWTLFVFFLFTSFIIQERFPFLLTSLMTIFIIWSKTHNKFILFIFGFLSIIILIPYLMNSDLIQNSRLFTTSNDLDDDTRIPIFQKSIEFINSNLIYGGVRSGIKYIGSMPHNFILNAFLYGGIVGGITVLMVILFQFRKSFYFVYKKKMLIIPLAFIAYSLNGLTHNNSIVTGDVMLWILWGIIDSYHIGNIRY